MGSQLGLKMIDIYMLLMGSQLGLKMIDVYMLLKGSQLGLKMIDVLTFKDLKEVVEKENIRTAHTFCKVRLK
jgi:hypothetical protein